MHDRMDNFDFIAFKNLAGFLKPTGSNLKSWKDTLQKVRPQFLFL
jgi:hypothetical protein